MALATSVSVTIIIFFFFLFRVFSVVYYTASSISQASSITPDVSKSKASAARILSLLKRKPRLNLSAGDDGKTLVHNSYNT